MQLGNKIFELRTAGNLSQSELAERLGVSRQAVSKWETDAAIPDLDNLTGMCDVFGVTLDELTGRAAPTPQTVVVARSATVTVPKLLGCILIPLSLIGLVLLCLLAQDAEDLYVPVPVLISALACGILCLCLKANVGYWCAWVACAPIIILTPHVVGLPVLSGTLVAHAVLLCVMGVVGTKQFAPLRAGATTKRSVLLVLAWGITVLLYAARLFLPLLPHVGGDATRVEWFLLLPFNGILYAALAALLTYTIRYKKASK